MNEIRKGECAMKKIPEFFKDIVMGIIGFTLFLIGILVGKPVYPGDPGE